MGEVTTMAAVAAMAMGYGVGMYMAVYVYNYVYDYVCICVYSCVYGVYVYDCGMYIPLLPLQRGCTADARDRS